MARKGKESKAALNKRILPTYSVELLPKRQNLLVPSGHTSKTERGRPSKAACYRWSSFSTLCTGNLPSLLQPISLLLPQALDCVLLQRGSKGSLPPANEEPRWTRTHCASVEQYHGLFCTEGTMSEGTAIK